MTEVRDRWAAGSTYEDFMGRWSRQLAPRFVSWLQVPAGAHWLDVGCGTGALTDAICSHADPASVLGCDPAEPFIEYARRQSKDARASFVAAGAASLPGRMGGYGCVASLLALNFFPDPEAAVREMRSLAAPRGAVSACVWDYGGRMDLLRCFWDAAAALDPAARLEDVRCEPIEIPTSFATFDDYWRPLLGGTGPAPSYVASLDDDRRSALARRLEAQVPRGPAGSIAMTARAWAIRGTAT